MAKKTARELFIEGQRIEGRKGGLSTLKKYGVSHFSKAANIRWGNKKKKK